MDFYFIDSIYIPESFLEEAADMCKNEHISPIASIAKVSLHYFSPEDWEWDKLQESCVVEPIACKIRAMLWEDNYEEKWIKEN